MTRAVRWLLATLAATIACGDAHDPETLARAVEAVVRRAAVAHGAPCEGARLAVIVDVEGVRGELVAARLAREGLAVRAVPADHPRRADACVLRVAPWPPPHGRVPAGAVLLSVFLDPTGERLATREDVAVLGHDGGVDVRSMELLSYL